MGSPSASTGIKHPELSSFNSTNKLASLPAFRMLHQQPVSLLLGQAVEHHGVMAGMAHIPLVGLVNRFADWTQCRAIAAGILLCVFSFEHHACDHNVNLSTYLQEQIAT